MEQNELEREWASHSTYHVRYDRPGVLLRFLVSLSSMSTRAVLSSPLSAVVVAVPDTQEVQNRLWSQRVFIANPCPLPNIYISWAEHLNSLMSVSIFGQVLRIPNMKAVEWPTCNMPQQALSPEPVDGKCSVNGGYRWSTYRRQGSSGYISCLRKRC